MSATFTGIPGVVFLLDDIVVQEAILATCNKGLARVLDVLARHTLTVNEEKSTFAASVSLSAEAPARFILMWRPC